ncbi:MAG: vWA domain-containing protein [Solirubrobacterales bacterium]
MSRGPGDTLVRKLVGFGRVLREDGVEIGPGRIQDAFRALDVVGIGSSRDVYWALRCTLIARREDIDAFSEAFAWFWTPPGVRDQEPDEEELEDGDRVRSPAVSTRYEASAAAAAECPGGDRAAPERGMAASSLERLRHMDFVEYGPDDLRVAREAVQQIARAMPKRRSRRMETAHQGTSIDKRRTLRSAMRTAGHPLERWWKQPRLVPRKLVFLLDISGSMEPYARAVVMFLQVAVRSGRRVEAFTFGTRLTRITRELSGQDPDRALRAAARAVPDWAGGTQIGENLAAFNDLGSRTGTGRGAVLVIVSDGWERGDPKVLSREMARAYRLAHTTIWVNPAAGQPGYEPIARGMAAAMEHVDVFLPGHDLQSLETLAGTLESLPAVRHQARAHSQGRAGRARSIQRSI